MKKLIGLGLLLTTGCDEHKVNMLDSARVKSSCSVQVECEMEQIKDSDYYDLEDEDAYQKYLYEACVDEYNDNLAVAREFKCGAEYKAYTVCMSDNYIDECDYDLTDSDEWEEYEEDTDELYNETCWVARQQYNECMPWF